MKDSDWEILHELYKNPNMTKVANLLYMTQPSLTKRLQHMEEEFQITIVERTTKGLKFTPEGEFLAKRGAAYLEFLDETKESLEEMKKEIQRTIIIGASYTYTKYTLTDVLVRYKAEHSNISFEIINEQSNILFRKMLEGSIDVGIIRGDYEGPVNKVLMGKSKAYLVTGEPIELEELPKYQRIWYKTNDKTTQILSSWWENRFGVKEPEGMQVGYVDFAWQLIKKGLGYTYCFLPENFVNEHDLSLTPLTNKDGTFVYRNTWFLYPKNKRMTETLENFITYIEKDVAGKYPV